MDKKKYPTRMHEILGVEQEERFTIKRRPELGKYYVNDKGEVMMDGAICPRDRIAVYLINHPENISHKPKLTEAQVRHLKGWALVGATHIAKDEDRDVRIYWSKPIKRESYWYSDKQSIYENNTASDCLRSLVAWSDPEPLGIVETLWDAGVDVD